jgi:hypothetical protein
MPAPRGGLPGVSDIRSDLFAVPIRELDEIDKYLVEPKIIDMIINGTTCAYKISNICTLLHESSFCLKVIDFIYLGFSPCPKLDEIHHFLMLLPQTG